MSTDQERYQAGLEVRREVMGDAYVDGALKAADEFTEALQEHLNTFCWGVAWTRSGIDRRTRSLVTLAALATLGRSAEVRGHTLGALRNGATPEEIREVLLQVAIYAGVPAAVDAFRAAQPVVAEHRAGKGA